MPVLQFMIHDDTYVGHHLPMLGPEDEGRLDGMSQLISRWAWSVGYGRIRGTNLGIAAEVEGLTEVFPADLPVPPLSCKAGEYLQLQCSTCLAAHAAAAQLAQTYKHLPLRLVEFRTAYVLKGPHGPLASRWVADGHAYAFGESMPELVEEFTGFIAGNGWRPETGPGCTNWFTDRGQIARMAVSPARPSLKIRTRHNDDMVPAVLHWRIDVGMMSGLL